MHRTRIKICGVNEPWVAIEAQKAGADAIGLVFVEKSPRYVDPDMAETITAHTPALVEPVGLFVDTPATEITRICRIANIHTVQLHGSEDPSIADQLPGLRIIRALPFQKGVIEEAKAWAELRQVRAILYDTPPKKNSELTGGSGESFDWSALAQPGQGTNKHQILAGGLKPGNVGHAIHTVRPYAVDVSSGVESSRGVKDVGLIKAFCKAVRAADDTIPAL